MAVIPLVAVIMGSQSDWETMKLASETLERLGVAHECLIVSAHRTPDRLFAFAEKAEAKGIRVIIAGAGGAAHLPGMCASKTVVPVLGVPVVSKALNGLDSLLSIMQMPAGIPVGTLAIGTPGAVNAALLAAAIVANERPAVRRALHAYRKAQTAKVGKKPVDTNSASKRASKSKSASKSASLGKSAIPGKRAASARSTKRVGRVKGGR